ncbi:hypothetical protein [Actinoplanes utahensis]|nr:hypothetical protein [Actinoplanes utahensis]
MPAPGLPTSPGMPPGPMSFGGPGQGMPSHQAQGGPQGHILPTGALPQIQITTNQPDSGVAISGQILPPAAPSGSGDSSGPNTPPSDGHPHDMPVR